MSRDEILAEIKKFFDKEELFCPHVIAKYGDRCWRFMDTYLLWCLLILRRDIVKVPLYCNSKTQHQKGFRCNMCDLVKSKKQCYVTAHGLGKAVDLVSGVPSMTAAKMRELIKENADLFPCKIRLEKWDSNGNEINWLHMDVIDEPQNPKIYEFKA